MEKLINILKDETNQLKIDYIEKTIIWADKDFNEYVTRSKWVEKDWANFLGVETEIRLGKEMFKRGFYNTKDARVLERNQNEVRRVLNLGKNKYVESAVKEANLHYESSIHKLADRVNQKRLNLDQLKVKTAYIDHNLETILTDGEKTVHAFTVLAFGPIQRPHYRYLIK